MDYYSLTVTQLKEQIRDRSIHVPAISGKRHADLVRILEQQDERDRIVREAREARNRLEEAHRQMRLLCLRRQEGAEALVGELEYPFSFLRSGEYQRECEDMPGQPLEDIGNFPDNIAEYYWIRPGENDERPWLTLCRLDTGLYVYYRGESDYTGFDCQGDMKIYASQNPNILLQYAMTSADYDAYLAETVALK